jgi:DEAD/DEAH box helicase domain-containing protein
MPLAQAIEESRVSLEAAIRELRTAPALAPNVADWRILPAEAPRHAEWPTGLDRRVTDALRSRGIERPYTHQAAAIDLALGGRDTVVVTPTASGKTLCYNVPVLESILRDPDARALYLFPTKALAQDQLNELHELITEAEIDVKTFTYDGDTSPAERRRVRTAGHVVLTNPDMLHTAILPHHTKWVRLFENLRYIVIDELHTYRGVFGSHVANVLRRLQRICRFYGAEPIFICCSATIRNPAELAAALTGREVTLVDDSGAPRGERHVVLYNPPVVNAELGIRRGVIRSATDIASLIQQHGPQTLVFAGSRTNVELLTTYLRELPGGRPRHAGAPDPVRGYRAGYLPKERRAIEAGLRNGDIRTVVGTNALELGIDIGGIDATVVAGYPGTLASLWQQAGRAGRRAGSSLSVFIAGSGPLDQYVVNHSDYVFGAPVEAGLIDADNPLIAADHLKCAVFELPVNADEHEALGEHTTPLLDALEQGGLLHLAGDRAYWMNEAYPANEVSLRSGPDQNVVILDQGRPPVRHEDEQSRAAVVIGEIDPPAARLLVHDQAIYIHDGRQYHVDRLDWEELKAYVHAVDVDYYTDAHLAVDLKVLDEWDARSAPVTHGHGEVGVTYLATLFKKIRLHTHENIGWGKIILPQEDLHSSAFWLALPDDLVAGSANSLIEGTLHGLGQLLHNVAPLFLMSDPRDLQLANQIKSPHTGRPTVFLWETAPGGVGFSEHLFANTGEVLRLAQSLVVDCECTDGCPACVGPPAAPGLGVKSVVVEAIERLTSDEVVTSAPDLVETAVAG